jgi:FAD/FMN-containing dehydrogenase
MRIQSWGGMHGEVASLAQPGFSCEIAEHIGRPRSAGRPKCLVIGNLRSYGDEVLSVDGHYVQTTRCDRVLGIDREKDTLTAECGISIDSIQRRVAPLGYELPVTPGTAFLTLGGAIANDVHGKNHHIAGTFGCHVERFELVRSTGEALRCSLDENPDWFCATIGGMGLTGAITWATIRLRRVATPWLQVRSRRFASLDGFFRIDDEESRSNEYTVAWVDCLATGKSLGRGIYSVANPARTDAVKPSSTLPRFDGSRASVPVKLPVSPVNRLSLSLMNALYYGTHRAKPRQIHYKRWMYPLDSIGHWNRLYGPRGFRQFQCVVPPDGARQAVGEMLATIAARGQGSFLAVLKNFGSVRSPGLMSFPMAGTTLALDFANRGAPTAALLLRLHQITAAAGGRLYAAKDGCSPAESLAGGYPNFERFKSMIDPGMGSQFAQRLRLLGGA